MTEKSSLYLELACWSDSNPPSEPKWIRIDEEQRVRNISEQSDNGRSVWVDQRGKNGDISVVVIKKPQDHHLGAYICTATNEVGEGHQMITLKGKLSNLIDLQLFKTFVAKLLNNLFLPHRYN